MAKAQGAQLPPPTPRRRMMPYRLPPATAMNSGLATIYEGSSESQSIGPVFVPPVIKEVEPVDDHEPDRDTTSKIETVYDEESSPAGGIIVDDPHEISPPFSPFLRFETSVKDGNANLFFCGLVDDS